MKNFLLEYLKKNSILKGNFTLSSGEKSSYYIDARISTLSSESLGDIHRTELFYTNDDGLYFLKLNDKDAPDLKGIEGLKKEDKIEKILELFRESRIKIHDGRAKIPDVPPGLAIHNTWSVNKPGTTLFLFSIIGSGIVSIGLYRWLNLAAISLVISRCCI